MFFLLLSCYHPKWVFLSLESWRIHLVHFQSCWSLDQVFSNLHWPDCEMFHDLTLKFHCPNGNSRNIILKEWFIRGYVSPEDKGIPDEPFCEKCPLVFHVDDCCLNLIFSVQSNLKRDIPTIFDIQII